jgi:hypothetical protein
MAKAVAAVRLPTPSIPVNNRAWGMDLLLRRALRARMDLS